MLSRASWSTLGERHVAFGHRRSSYIAWALCVTLAGLLLLAPPSLAANDRVAYVDNNTLWTADSQGGNREQVTDSENRIFTDDLSPDGTTAVVAGFFHGASGLSLVNVATHVRTQLYTGEASPAAVLSRRQESDLRHVRQRSRHQDGQYGWYWPYVHNHVERQSGGPRLLSRRLENRLRFKHQFEGQIPRRKRAATLRGERQRQQSGPGYENLIGDGMGRRSVLLPKWNNASLQG